jgi:large subunit ribosomal protein L30
MAKKYLQVTLVRSTNKKLQAHKDCVRGLGLRKLNSTAKVEDTNANRGMINKVSYLLKVEEV